ncbi:MAG: hypothetical protein RR334_01495 [Clostridia bacterium]
MEIFEYLRTAFNVVVAVITPDILLISGLVIWALFLFWCVCSLCFNYERKFSAISKNIIKFLKDNTLTKENYNELTGLIAQLPPVVRRNWKNYELQNKGTPSSFILQSDCVDHQIFSGIHKQNRSIMTWFIMFCCLVISVLSLAVVGAGEAVLSAKIVSEACLIPLALFLVLKISYYIYTAIRHYEYRVAVDNYNDLIDVLDERVDLAKIFSGYEEAIGLVSDIYENETLKKLGRKTRVSTDSNVPELKMKSTTKSLKVFNKNMVEDKEFNNSKTKELLAKIDKDFSATVIHEDAEITNKKKNLENKAQIEKPSAIIKKRGRPRKETSNEPFEINSEKEFLIAMEKVEKLIDKQAEPSSVQAGKKLQNSINELVSAMTKYKDKK